MRSISLGLGVLLCLSATNGFAKGEDISTGGKIVADSGFRAKPNGFKFENWGGGERPEGDLDAEDARYLFGDSVCESIENDECTPTPAAELWIEQMNKSMEGGHCEGMAALSAAFYSGYENADEYGKPTAFALPPEEEVLRVISTYFTTQMLEPVVTESLETQDWRLDKIVKTLREHLKKGAEDFYTLGIYSGGGGHAVTPYAVEEMPDGKFRIHIYDNNYPGEGKFVEVDTKADRWIYGGAALNPKEDPGAWSGRSGSMDLTSVSVRLGELECPFCGDETASDEEEDGDEGEDADEEDDEAGDETADAEEAEDTEEEAKGSRSSAPPAKGQAAQAKPAATKGIRAQAAPSGKPQGPASLFALVDGNCDRVQIQEGGRNLKMEDGKLTNEIKGSAMRRLRGSRSCWVQLPAEGDYQVNLLGAAKQALTDVTFISPGRVFKVAGLDQAPGQVDKFRIGGGGMSYTAGSSKSPVFKFATDNPHGDDALYTLNDAAAMAGKNFTVKLDRKSSALSFASEGEASKSMVIRAVVSGEKGKREFTFDQVKTDLQGWGKLKLDAEGDVKLKMNKEGKGAFSKFWGDGK